MAELRKQALLASGVQIEGLQQQQGGGAPKKVVYGNRKKKGPVATSSVTGTASGPGTRDPSPVRTATPPPPPPAVEPTAAKAEEAGDDVKSDWEADSGDEAAKKDVKDSWDDSSDEEEAPAKAEPINI